MFSSFFSFYFYIIHSFLRPQRKLFSTSTITNGIQNAISHAWAKTPLDELMKNYTAVVNYKTGEPTPMELIYHYAEKIRKEI